MKGYFSFKGKVKDLLPAIVRYEKEHVQKVFFDKKKKPSARQCK